MLVKTKNSTYRVTAHGDKFHIQKVSAENPASTYLLVGHCVVSSYLKVCVGEPMRFSNVVTSRVEAFTEE